MVVVRYSMGESFGSSVVWSDKMERFEDESGSIGLENDFSKGFADASPVRFVNSAYGACGIYRLVGHGPVTSELCASYRGRYGCLETELHKLPLQLRGKKWENQIFQHPVFY